MNKIIQKPLEKQYVLKCILKEDFNKDLRLCPLFFVYSENLDKLTFSFLFENIDEDQKN
jgi:hypothetical protein